jgi:hypothetical protein
MDGEDWMMAAVHSTSSKLHAVISAHDGWLDGWLDGLLDGWLNECMDRWMDG